MDLETFLQQKKDYIFNSYYDTIRKIEKGYWHVSRNSTNYRLDTNITNMCSDLVDEILRENDLVEIDLMNSQFSILSHILPKHLDSYDTSIFKELAYSGELYDYLQNVLQLETRKEAKNLTFELLFSSPKNKNPHMPVLKELFPEVIGWINEYKEKYGTSAFAVMLQKKESEIFIDKIWYGLKKKGKFAITKHDCIICRKTDQADIMFWIEDLFKKIKFEGRLLVKNPAMV